MIGKEKKILKIFRSIRHKNRNCQKTYEKFRKQIRKSIGNKLRFFLKYTFSILIRNLKPAKIEDDLQDGEQGQVHVHRCPKGGETKD